MIVITGPGRGGTSLIASLYKELGFDPGGEWFDDTNAGFEDAEIVRVNGQMIRDLRLTVMASRDASEKFRREHGREYDDAPPPRIQTAVRSLVESVALRMLGRQAQQLDLMPWDQISQVTEAYRPRLLELARTRAIVKDPLFCWTLGLWAEAGVPIEHVLLCVRNVDAMVQSRVKAGQVLFRGTGIAKNSFIYGMGMCLATVSDYRIPYDIVRFPDFLDDPEALRNHLRFPRPIGSEEFAAALARISRPELVHDHS